MNWIILLLLFGCCGGCGNDCGCNRGFRRCENNCDRNCDCMPNRCRECARAREAVHEAKEDVREALRDVRDAKERAQAVCDGPGMVPPTWQDYPPMPRRDKNDKDCGCDN